jgi:SWIM zinc finger
VAGEGDVVKNEIIRQLAAFDDEALALLANKGLVRRAAKDLEKGTAVVIESDDAETLRVRVEDVTVTFDAGGPAKARCGCPARENCRHVIMACLWLKAQPVEEAVAAPAASDPLTWKSLVRWCGKRVALAGAELRPYEIASDGKWFVVRFPEIGETVRLLPDNPLATALCTCKTEACKHAAGALIVFGKIEVEAEAPAPPPATQPPRTRAEVLESTMNLFAELLTIGLSQLSDSTRQRLATLAVSAHGVDLPRLSLALRSIADDVRLMLARDARWDSSRLFLSLARTYALCHALQHSGIARPDLEGAHRSCYEDVRSLDAYGLGAYKWQTASGYRGLTLLFWSPSANDWLTWSDARPASQQFDPEARLFGEPPWQGAGSPCELSRSHVRLTHARKNGQNRLSSSSKTTALPVDATVPRWLDFGTRAFDDWPALRAYAATTQPVGLELSRPNATFVVLRSSDWGKPVFDPLHQQLRRPILDVNGDELTMVAQFREGDERAVRALETLRPSKAKIWGVVARLTVGSELLLWPISFLTDAKPAIAFLDLPEQPSTKQPIAHGPQAEEDLDAQDEDEPPASSGIPSIHELIAQTESIAERGVMSLATTLHDSVAALATKMDASGLRTLGREAESVCTATTTAQRAEHLLRARYIADVSQSIARST